MKLLHSADWQIGAAFQQFGDRSGRLRSARLASLRRALGEAEAHAVDAFVIAGDLFEDNQIDPATAAAVFALFEEFRWTPIFVLPGNHDPYTGPGSIWARPPFDRLPPHVKVFTKPEAIRVGDGWLLGNPITQKRSTIDPTLALGRLASELPADQIKAGITHGSLQIETRSAPDDFPIPLDAASRRNLDFLGIGHWHTPRVEDGGRMLMPGTPEPDAFSQSGAGFVHLVQIRAHGVGPEIQPIRVAELEWIECACDAGRQDAALQEGEKIVASAPVPLPRMVVRICLRGAASASDVNELRARLEERLAECAALDVRDETLPELDAVEMEAIRSEHPLAALVLDDLSALESYAGGAASGLSASDYLSICERIGCSPSDAAPSLFSRARRILLEGLRVC